MNDTYHLVFATDIVGLVVGFLKYSDAVGLCMTNKLFYSIFKLVVAKYSFVSVNTTKLNGLNIAPFFNTMNLYINSIRKVKEPIFSYIERINVNRFSNLKYLHFGPSFNQQITNLPSTVESIIFDPKSRFNHRINNIGCNLRHITFGKHFNQPIDSLPDTVTVIRFAESSRFNKFIYNAPASLSEIHFGIYFNRNIDNLKQVKKITFTQRSCFNQELCIDANDNIYHLALGMYYNRNLNIADSHIKVLKFHKLSRYNHVLNLPSSLEHIFIGKQYNRPIYLPPNATLKCCKKTQLHQLTINSEVYTGEYDGSVQKCCSS